MATVLILLGLFLVYAAVSAVLARTPLTAPILFTAAGVGVAVSGLVGPEPRRGAFLLPAAELGLVLLLFADAARVDPVVLRGIRRLPTRLLGIGLPLTLLLGGAAAEVVFPGLGLWFAGVLSAVLAPTDAGLGQVVVSDPRVPVEVRQALNVEAGLNDGIAVPFLLFFLALAAAGSGDSGPALHHLVLEQLGFGTLVGLGAGLVGGRVLRIARDRQWTADAWEGIAVVTIPAIAAVGAHAVHASAFIAAFVAGFSVRSQYAEAGHRSAEFTEAWGQLLNLTVFFLFGLVLVREGPDLRPAHLLYALLSLTIVRMLPVAVALRGAGLPRKVVLFMGWFGPRGLASIVLALVVLEGEGGDAVPRDVILAATATVALSILLHGLTARPAIAWLARTRGEASPPAA